MNKKIFTLVLLTICMFSFLFAEQNSSAAAYMRLGTGAKAMAMGGTGVASIDNITATYWNPAGLANLKTFEFGSMIADGLGWDRSYNYSAIGFRLPNGYAALSWNNANVSDFEGYDENDNFTGNFDNSEHNIGLSYALGSPKFKLGATVKAFISSIDGDFETGYGTDLGIIYDANQYFSIGVMCRDLYSEYVNEEVPSQYSFGITMHPIYGLTLNSDFKAEKDDENIEVGVGAEYWIGLGEDVEVSSTLGEISVEEKTSWDDVLSNAEGGLRVGIDDGSFTAGFGLRYKVIEASYAYGAAKDDKLTEDSHRFSLIFRF